MEFKVLYKRMQKDKQPPHKMLCLDPGFTTGVAVFTDGVLTDWLQVETIKENDKGKPEILWQNYIDLFERMKPTLVVCENYRIYQHKLNQHANSSVDTLRLIGGIDMYCKMHKVPIRYQMANEHKGFCDDKKLQMWGYWKPGMRHSRDAIRVGTYFLLFNKEDL